MPGSTPRSTTTAPMPVPDHRSRRAGAPSAGPRYPRTARVNRVVQEVIAEELERLGDGDPRLHLVTVTGVTIDPDLRHATVWLGSLTEEVKAALAEGRVSLQAAIGRQVRMKRTPLLTFAPDPAVASGSRIEEILRTLPADNDGGS
jgi:ribosome-binding factor A